VHKYLIYTAVAYIPIGLPIHALHISVGSVYYAFEFLGVYKNTHINIPARRDNHYKGRDYRVYSRIGDVYMWKTRFGLQTVGGLRYPRTRHVYT
jgi:hypothetical protein